MAVLGCLSLPLSVMAEEHSEVSKPWEQTQQAVHDLMHQETETLRQQRQLSRDMASGHDTLLSATPTDEGCLFGCTHHLQLVSLYGVGADIYVELRHAGQTYLYAPGQRYPLGRGQDEAIPILKKISGRCVALQVEDQEIQQCLLPTPP